jgi:hypothetical protein
MPDLTGLLLGLTFAPVIMAAVTFFDLARRQRTTKGQ